MNGEAIAEKPLTVAPASRSPTDDQSEAPAA